MPVFAWTVLLLLVAGTALVLAMVARGASRPFVYGSLASLHLLAGALAGVVIPAGGVRTVTAGILFVAAIGLLVLEFRAGRHAASK